MDSDKAGCHSADKAITCEEVAYMVQRQADRLHKACAKRMRALFWGLHSQTTPEKSNTLLIIDQRLFLSLCTIQFVFTFSNLTEQNGKRARTQKCLRSVRIRKKD